MIITIITIIMIIIIQVVFDFLLSSSSLLIGLSGSGLGIFLHSSLFAHNVLSNLHIPSF